MRVDAIRAWIDSVDSSSPFIDFRGQISLANTTKKRRLSDNSMESPSKWKPREQPEAETPFDPDKTPQSSSTLPMNSIFDHPPPSLYVTGSTIDSFLRTLAARPHFPKSTADLHRFNRPIRFSLEPDLKAALPPDAHDLYKALHDVQWGTTFFRML
ncbi:uncharacterized protein FFB20_07044 [Fusarium fujikuroi]|nr:uncharacterized protein FFB20_07044 [Fusarium fujikuroi]SCO20263.1 uncharacterized protein FFE2_14559 [Fusarium fujikuroi]SCV59635.1 uncharacterized protein FFFS_14204 [Fusarium fujikuroi]